ncbi:Uncharacterized protein OS=Singulisphaera acidiphila (strain ATCC BAA-1392 / DSM 18658 / VKM B-2454 / MOB10) GN=Sinac_0934 PE=4 SV=1: SBP_bac_10 [Gemmata massiliana]|uniref:DUF1559 domain-containing protein n=1 Tax=Gemmata massiliana TaxID=1210884 RepID=A0A6P2DA37_9BACT|nr:DUF1559 domain-containing protein [Gemmata massiliana]VTR97225.1 Uncharacterized protein OS=Singulisphaera acidiphila (strain ATCC BAA-1392 / DSM 18658 / VKM B-2454 / MOB10) GN=Sinac_0934 PE=4 SV=1: SBP_bac_10 [Gemmata massiliana]
MPRRSLIVPFGILFTCLVLVPACKKKPPPTAAPPEPSAPTSTVSSDYLLFAHLNVKDIRDGAIFTEVKQAFAKAGGGADWDQLEGRIGREAGVKPTDVDAVTVCMTEAPARGEPNFVLIVAANRPMPKTSAFGLNPQAKPDARGFYQMPGGGLIHFPNDKTAVLLSSALVPQYLEGYAKNQTSGWPLTPDLTKSAAGHTAFVVARLDKLPAEARNSHEFKDFAPFLTARTVTVMADLKGKELSATARVTFPDATAASRAKEKGQELIKMATGEVEKLMTGQSDLAAVLPAVKEAHRTLQTAKVEVSGSDLTLAAGYKADFDLGQMVTEAVKKIQNSAEKITTLNNFKQVGLALHNYHSVYNAAPVHGIGPKGALLKNANEKPLLSWRVAILPYLEQDNLYRQFKLDEPWDSEHNKKLVDKMPKVFTPVGKPGKPGYTHTQMAVGPNALQLPAARIPTSFPDGTSNTIAVIEAAEPVIWTKPDDVMLPGAVLPKDLKKKFGGVQPGGFNVAMWDGSARFIPDTVSERTLGLLLNPRDGQVIPSDW